MKILIFLFIFSILFCGCKQKIQRISDFEGLKKDIYKRYPKIEASEPSSYKRDVYEENFKKLTFPMVKPTYALLYKHNLLKPVIKLNDNKLKDLLKMLNDSANYVWGEIGTPEFDLHIIFYDKTDRCVGLANVSYDGVIYLDPYLKKMKWGMVKEPVLDLIKSIK